MGSGVLKTKRTYLSVSFKTGRDKASEEWDNFDFCNLETHWVLNSLLDTVYGYCLFL